MTTTEQRLTGGDWNAVVQHRIAEIDNILVHSADQLLILTEAQIEAKQDKVKRLKRHRQRISELQSFTFDNGLSSFDTGRDDQVVKGEFHLPVGQEVEFVFRSRDVIHSAFHAALPRADELCARCAHTVQDDTDHHDR